ncbi:MAG: Rrf2 family transcriptional regulator [Bacteroidota bacterium]
MANIINFSDAASIGLHSMIIIAKSDKPINAIQLSEKLGKSKHHIGKILQRLVKDGLLTSTRGPSGGFEIIVDPKEITLYDVYTCIEGKSRVKLCSEDHHICPVDKCIRKNLIKRLSDEFISYMDSQKLSDYL